MLTSVARSCVRALPVLVVVVHTLLSISRATMLYKGMREKRLGDCQEHAFVFARCVPVHTHAYKGVL